MIYISGAITGTTDYLERFSKAEEKLKKKGYIVINPAKVNSNLPVECNHADYMTVSFAMLELCDSIYMLKGWENSKGSALEHTLAKLKGYEIIEE